MIWPLSYVADYLRLRKTKERTEEVLKTFVDNRSMQTYLPQAPEIIPYPQNGAAIRTMVYRVPTLRAIIENLTTEVFRRYPDIVPAFQMKCPRCKTEYQTYKKVCDNPDCVLQGIENQPPDPTQKQKFLEWKDCVNRNGQSFWDVCKQFNWESDALDNPWAVFSYDYVVDPLTSEIVSKKLMELNIARAETMRMIQDNYGVPGGLYYTCIEHRNVRKTAKEKFEPCPHCGKMLYDVKNVSVKLNQPTGEGHSDSIDNMYIVGETFTKPYWTHTTNYGISNVYSLWIHATTLWYMDELENSIFKHGRPPKSLLIFNSYNPAAITAQLNDEIRNQELNRNYMMKLAYPFENKTPAQVLNLLPNDTEIKTLEHRAEIKKEMGILYGQNPFFLGDMSTGSGLNNEGMQQETMLKREETKMKWLEEGLFKAVFEALGITDWVLKFPAPKESDRMAVITRRQANIKMIGEILDRGASYNIVNDEDWEFQIIGQMTKLENPAQVGQKELPGMEGWDTRDFQVKDQTFAFSKMTDEAKDLIMWFIGELRIVADLSNPNEHIKPLITGFREKLREHLMLEWTRRVRRGMTDAGADPEEVDIDREVVQLYAGKGEMDKAIDELMDFIGNAFDADHSMGSLIAFGSELRSRVNNIIETEEAVFTNLGRVSGYELMDPDDKEYDYDWVGPEYSPGRSTEVCQAIKDRVGNVRGKKGRVSLEELRQIVREEGDKPHGNEKAFGLGREFMPHYNCYLKGTQVLTVDHGWMNIEEIPVGTRVFTFDMKKGEINITAVNNSMKREHDGEFVRIHNRWFDLTVTDDHPMIVYDKYNDCYKRKNINELHSNDSIPIGNFKYAPAHISYPPFEIFKNFSDYVKFMAWYLSEGSVFQREDGGCVVGISQEKVVNRPEIIELMKGIFDKVWAGKEKISAPISKEFYDYLKSFGHSYEKHIPDDIKKSDVQYLNEFLEVYIKGDGAIVETNGLFKSKVIAIFTISPKMVSDISELILKTGNSAKIIKDTPKEVKHHNGIYKSKYDIYRIYIKRSNGAYIKRLKIDRFKDRRTVYDIEVGQEGTIFVNFKGNIFGASNCRHVIVGRNPVMGKRLRYIHDPSEAPDGVEVKRGPRGGYYYDEAVRGSSGGGEDELDGGDAQARTDTPGDGAENGKAKGQAEYTAVQIRQADGETFAVKYADPNQLEQIKQVLANQGYQLDEKSGVYVYMMEAVPNTQKGEKFDPEQVIMGIKVEMEHTDDVLMALKIAMDHLREDKEYYTKLKEAGL